MLLIVWFCSASAACLAAGRHGGVNAAATLVANTKFGDGEPINQAEADVLVQGSARRQFHHPAVLVGEVDGAAGRVHRDPEGVEHVGERQHVLGARPRRQLQHPVVEHVEVIQHPNLTLRLISLRQRQAGPPATLALLGTA
jgi:hypothetical protein